MCIHTHLSLALFGVIALLVPSAQAQQLDYARTIEQSSMVFVPTVGTNRGPIYYTQYEQVPGATSVLGDLRRIVVSLWPTAHRQNLYNSFLIQNGITDARQLYIPEFGTCQPTEQIKERFAHMPDGFKPNILGGTYPVICKLSLYFLPEEEADVRALLDAGPVMTLRGTVPLCDQASRILQVSTINQRLTSDGVLTTNTTGVTGNSWDVLYASARLAQLNPSLFAIPDPQTGWEAYVKGFTLDLAAETATMPTSTASQPQYICTPAPLVLQFG